LLQERYFFCGYLKVKKGWKTGYTRKTFHFCIFVAAAMVQKWFGLSGTFIFGTGVTLVLVVALVRGAGNVLYEAIAREKDEPHRTYYIVVPYLATLSG